MKDLILTERQEKLWQWVKEQHGDQKRKYTGDPYYTHLWNVAQLVNDVAPELVYGVEVALCHDLLEDTETDNSWLFFAPQSFGYNAFESDVIYDYVQDLTDQYTKEAYPDLNRKERKQLEAERLKTIFPLAQTVKYADIIDNTSSIVKYDPSFAKVYLSEKEMYILDMNSGNSTLHFMCLDTLAKAHDKLYLNFTFKDEKPNI